MTKDTSTIALVGSGFEAGDLLTRPLFALVEAVAPGARTVRPTLSAASGALLLAARAAGVLGRVDVARLKELYGKPSTAVAHT